MKYEILVLMQELREKNWKVMDVLEKVEKFVLDKIIRVEKEIKVNFLLECLYSVEVNVVWLLFY